MVLSAIMLFHQREKAMSIGGLGVGDWSSFSGIALHLPILRYCCGFPSLERLFYSRLNFVYIFVVSDHKLPCICLSSYAPEYKESCAEQEIDQMHV